MPNRFMLSILASEEFMVDVSTPARWWYVFPAAEGHFDVDASPFDAYVRVPEGSATGDEQGE